MRPLIVVEDAAALADELADVREAGFEAVSGWEVPPRDRVVCSGEVSTPADAAAVLLAVVRGAGVVAMVRTDRSLVAQLCDDLRRFGPVEYRRGGGTRRDRLRGDERKLLELLAAGSKVGEAATALGLSRRTAVRRLAAARAKLGVTTTAEAVVVAAERRRSPGAPAAGTAVDSPAKPRVDH
jgi:DNA-binding CsgD family transcriptional regulator